MKLRDSAHDSFSPDHLSPLTKPKPFLSPFLPLLFPIPDDLMAQGSYRDKSVRNDVPT
jgi:hypothetical protein